MDGPRGAEAMRVVAVPNELCEYIHSKINEQLAGRSITSADRDILYGQLLEYFDQHGKVPEFTIERKDRTE